MRMDRRITVREAPLILSPFSCGPGGAALPFTLTSFSCGPGGAALPFTLTSFSCGPGGAALPFTLRCPISPRCGRLRHHISLATGPIPEYSISRYATQRRE